MMLYVSYSWTDTEDESPIGGAGFGFGATAFDDRGAPRFIEDIAELRERIRVSDTNHPNRQVVLLFWTELL